jgi:hypothetical protein
VARRAAAYACGWMYYPRVRAHNALLPECVTPLDLRCRSAPAAALCIRAPQVRYCFFKDPSQPTHTPPSSSSNGNGFLLCAQGEMLIRGSAGGTNVWRTQNQGHKSLDPFECGPGLTILLCARSGCNFAALRYHGSAQHIKCALTSQSIKLKC